MYRPKNSLHTKAKRDSQTPGVHPLVRLRNHLTDRDRKLLGWLYDHHTLTTPQIANALFTSLDFTQRRLLMLTELQAVTRFRPNKLDGGSYPYHYVLDQLGFTYIMGERGEGPPRRDEARRRLQSVVTRPDLKHLLGGNQFFTDLSRHARTHAGCALEQWMPASAFHNFSPLFRWGDNLRLPVSGETRLPRPDGAGVWRQDGRAVPFFLEFDTGTERLEILAEKLGKYATLQGGTTWAWPALFVLPSVRRENNLHDWMAGYQWPLNVLWHTTSTEYLTTTQQSPTAAVWLAGLTPQQPGRETGLLRLIDLPYLDTDHDKRWHVSNPHHLSDGSGA